MSRRVSMLIGSVIKKSAEWRAVHVRVPELKRDEYLNLYHYTNEHHWAADPQDQCRMGDVVRIKSLPEPQSDTVHHEVKEMVLPLGNTVDPFTGRRCRGADFLDDEFRTVRKESNQNTTSQHTH